MVLLLKLMNLHWHIIITPSPWFGAGFMFGVVRSMGGFRQMCNDLYPSLWYQFFYRPKNLLFFACSSSLARFQAFFKLSNSPNSLVRGVLLLHPFYWYWGTESLPKAIQWQRQDRNPPSAVSHHAALWLPQFSFVPSPKGESRHLDFQHQIVELGLLRGRVVFKVSKGKWFPSRESWICGVDKLRFYIPSPK